MRSEALRWSSRGCDVSGPSRRREGRGLVAALASATAAVLLLSSVEARAQGAPPPPPPGFEQQQPPAQQPPPPPPYGGGYPGYAPPPGYYPPPGYSVPPAALIGPKTLDYEEGDPIPPGYHVDTRIRKGLLIGGAVTFGSLYLLSAITASSLRDASIADDVTPLYIPAVGPFVTIGTTSSEGLGTFLLIVDGVAQSGGLLMAILGLTLQETLLVRNDISSRPGAPRDSASTGGRSAGGVSMTVTPMQLGEHRAMGFGLVGRM